MTREEAYRLVQKNSMQAWNQGIALQSCGTDPEMQNIWMISFAEYF